MILFEDKRTIKYYTLRIEIKDIYNFFFDLLRLDVHWWRFVEDEELDL